MAAPARSPIERLVIAEIERRRSYARPAKDTTLPPVLDRIQRDLRASVRRETSLQAAWRRVAPADLTARVRALSLRGGTLTLGASDQSAKFLADRWMKGQGRGLLATAIAAAITRVVVKVESR